MSLAEPISEGVKLLCIRCLQVKRSFH